ncbi:hypothetical protein MKW98_031015, partial [Papaver atlanticum]
MSRSVERVVISEFGCLTTRETFQSNHLLKLSDLIKLLALVGAVEDRLGISGCIPAIFVGILANELPSIS